MSTMLSVRDRGGKKGKPSINVGHKYLTMNCGPIIITNKVDVADHYEVKFVRTGTVKVVRGSQITDGTVRDPYAPLLCGIAYTGNIKTKGKYKPYYSVWHDMINRCYNKKDKRYTSYKDVTVCKRWLCFENFYEDAKDLEGFNDDLIFDGILNLDKDYTQSDKKSKEYSPKTCIWLDKFMNNRLRNGCSIDYKAISPKGKVYIDHNPAVFAEQHDLKRKAIIDCLSGTRDDYHGWTFQYV